MPKTDKPRDSRRILVVDDEPRMTRFIRMKGSNLCFAIALTLATYAGLPPLKSVSVE